MDSAASTSRWPSAVNKSFHQLRQVSAEIGQLGSQGSKLIAANLVELRSARKKLESDVKDSECQGDFAEELRDNSGPEKSRGYQAGQAGVQGADRMNQPTTTSSPSIFRLPREDGGF